MINFDLYRIHKQHNPAFSHASALAVKFPEGIQAGPDGYVIIKGKTPIHIDIPRKDRAWFETERYCIEVFIDDASLAGELEGYSPYNFLFDPEQINPGKHLITINYIGSNDHIGIACIPVLVEDAGTQN
jgi:hypothetical protein